MARLRLSTYERWRIIGMRDSGMSCRAIARQLGYHHSVITRLVQKHAQTHDVKDRARSGRPKVTSVREDRALLRHVRRLPFTSEHVLRDNWNTHRRVSISTVRNRVRVLGYRDPSNVPSCNQDTSTHV